jgi:hypothetical protein
MDLIKYISLTKASRSNPFKDEPSFFEITKCLDSSLRNASHHGAINLTDDGKTVQYTSGKGTGSLKKMSYKEYIDRCNEIMLSNCALFRLELMLGL